MKQLIAVILSAEVVKVGLQKAKMTKFFGREPGTRKILSGQWNHMCLIHNFQLYNLEGWSLFGVKSGDIAGAISFQISDVAYAATRWGLVVAHTTGCICNHQANTNCPSGCICNHLIRHFSQWLHMQPPGGELSSFDGQNFM